MKWIFSIWSIICSITNIMFPKITYEIPYLFTDLFIDFIVINNPAAWNKKKNNSSFVLPFTRFFCRDSDFEAKGTATRDRYWSKMAEVECRNKICSRPWLHQRINRCTCIQDCYPNASFLLHSSNCTLFQKVKNICEKNIFE